MRFLPSPLVRARRSGVLLVLILGAVMTAGVWSMVPASLVAPRPHDRHVTTIVTELLRNQHISKQPLDEEITSRGLVSFLESLDPRKMYFNQSDIDEFLGEKDSLLEKLLDKKDISLAYSIFSRFLTRVDERGRLIEELLDEEFDFTGDEYLVIDPDAAAYPRNAEEARARWRRRIMYDLLVLKGNDTEEEDPRERLRRRYTSFARRMHQTDADELLEMYLTAFTSSYDPHTTYMSPSSLENFRIMMRLNLEGIGAALQFEDGYTKVSKVIPGGAADEHGKLRPEDRIISVGQGRDGEMVDVVDMKLNDVVNKIRGPAGTVVRLGVITAGSTETQIYEIVRAEVELKDSEARAEVLRVGPEEEPSAQLNVGVISLPSFYMDMEGAKNGGNEFKSTTRDVRRILADFTQQDVDTVVLDLRRNGGGSLTEAINLTGLFIEGGPVVQVKGSNQDVQVYEAGETEMAWKGPLVVLTSKFSASASEILAGAIQDYQRGLIVGDSATHGKGTVQSLLDLGAQLFRIPNPPNLGALKITMQQFYRPNGESTQKRGVLADIVLPSITDHMDISEGDLDYAMEFDKIDPARHDRFHMVSSEMIEELSRRSQSRRGESEEFARLKRNIERYVEQRAAKRISLNEEEFRARRAELDADREEERQFEDQRESDDVVVERDYYFDEVLKIAEDYTRMLQQQRLAQSR